MWWRVSNFVGGRGVVNKKRRDAGKLQSSAPFKCRSRAENCRRLEKLLEDLEARLRSGQNVYLHCWGGRGRAGTVGATLLHRLYDLPAQECLERVQRAYDTRNDTERAPPSQIVQTKDEERVIGLDGWELLINSTYRVCWSRSATHIRVCCSCSILVQVQVFI